MKKNNLMYTRRASSPHGGMEWFSFIMKTFITGKKVLFIPGNIELWNNKNYKLKFLEFLC